MISKEDLIKIIEKLTAGEVLSADEKENYLKDLEIKESVQVAAEMYFNLHEKLVDVDGEIVEASMALLTSLKEAGEAVGNKEVVAEVEKKEKELEEKIDELDANVENLAEEYQEISPILNDVGNILKE